MSEEQKLKVEVLMKDYEINRTYSTSISPGIRYNLISMTFATVGIIISGTIIALGTTRVTDLVAEIIAGLWCLFLPVFCFTLMWVWIGEEHRVIRMGEYNKQLEEKINCELGHGTLGWESYKRGSNTIKYPEVFILVTFLGLSLVSFIVGLYLFQFQFHCAIGAIVGIGLVVSVVHVALALYTWFQLKRNILAFENL